MAAKFATWTIVAVLIVTATCKFFLHAVPFATGFRLILVAALVVGAFALLTTRDNNSVITNRVEYMTPSAVAEQSQSLRTGATSKEIKAYVETHGLVGQTIPYDYDLIIDKASGTRELRHGEVVAAGTEAQEFVCGRHRTKSDKHRDNVFRRDYEDSLRIHAVKRA